MHTVRSRNAYADQLEADGRFAHCRDDLARCAECRAKTEERRAARRDALIHAVASLRLRRAVL